MDVGFYESKKDDERVFYAIHEDDAGTPDAFAMYGIKHEWPRGLPSSEGTVKRLVATTPGSHIAMWRYLCAIDLMARVKADTRPVDEPLQWLVEEPRALRPELEDGLFLRPVDVAAALSARGYVGSGELVIEVDDGYRPEAAGTFELQVDDGVGVCRRTDRARPRVLGRAVGSTYLGGVTWTTLAGAGRVQDRTPARWRSPTGCSAATAPLAGVLLRARVRSHVTRPRGERAHPLLLEPPPARRQQYQRSGSARTGGRSFDEWRVADREPDPTVGHLVEQRSHAGGHALGGPAARVLAREARDHGVLGWELLTRAAQDPCRGLRCPFGGGDEEHVVADPPGTPDILSQRPPTLRQRVRCPSRGA